MDRIAGGVRLDTRVVRLRERDPALLHLRSDNEGWIQSQNPADPTVSATRTLSSLAEILAVI